MKISKIINKIESNKALLPYKGNPRLYGGAALFYDANPEIPQVRKTVGACKRLRRSGYGTRAVITCTRGGILFTQSFYVNAPHFLGVRIGKKA